MSLCSPRPVVALIIPAWPAEGPMGIALIRRGTEPAQGEWTFPGGDIDHAESWRLAAVRKAREELGVALDQQHLGGRDVVTTPDNFLVLFVGHSNHIFQMSDFHQPRPATATIQDICVSSDTKNFSLGLPSHDAYWKELRLVPGRV